ncbi:MAG: PEP-CTERM sorting domain-containing protein [Phycisphaerales bacterium JB063]
MTFRPSHLCNLGLTAGLLALAQSADAVPLYASGQLLIPGDPGIPFGEPGHDDSRENYVFEIDSVTGVATPISPVTSGLPAGLGGFGGTLYGWSGNTLQIVDPITGITTAAGTATAYSATGFDVSASGVGYGITNSDDQLFSVDLVSGNATAVGAAGLVNNALADAGVTDADAFIISLASVGGDLYGLDLSTNSLVSIDPATGTAQVVGGLGSLDTVGGGVFSGYSALTGVDEDSDGQFDALFGAVNFVNPDGPEGSVRLGGVARFDLGDGTWDLVGLNEQVIFFGMASQPVPEPSSLALLGIAGACLLRRRRH